MKKLLTVFLTVLMLAGVCIPFASAADNDFVPVIRFIASSDTHVRDDSDTNANRIRMMLEETYVISDGDSVYNALDAFIVAGDLTNDGTESEFNKFWNAVSSTKREDTQFMGVVPKNHDGWTMNRKDMRNCYSSITGEEPDFHKVINGFHFIGISASPLDGVQYSDSQLKWLKAQLKEAVKDTPDKPVFFIHHEHNRNTVYGSSTYDGWGITRFKSILKNYPQVVDFSGHSHYPLNDPRSIWQGKYTCIGTGAIYYSEFTIDEMRAYDPPGCYDTATYWIVEVNAEGDLHLRGRDINADEQLCEYYISNPADKSNREYTPAKQKAASSAPAFADGAGLEIENLGGGKAKVSAPAAQSTDGKPVVLYRIAVKNQFGVTIEKKWVLPKYYEANTPDTVEFELENLANGNLEISVVAENAYGMQSSPLRLKLDVNDGLNPFESILAAIKAFFNHIKMYLEQLFG